MSRALSANAVPRIAFAAAALWVVACIGQIVWSFVTNPMDAREKALNARLETFKTAEVPDDLPKPDDAPMQKLRAIVAGKQALWKPLIAAPPPPPPPESKPDLLERLKGVTASLRDQIRTGDTIKVKVKMSPEDKRGRWVGVGDKVMGLPIKEIRDDSIVFSFEQNGKEYTAELPRR